MDISKIISIAGKPGLFQILSQSRGGVIVSSLQDGKKVAIGQTQRVSVLSDISVYTEEGDILLKEIFERIHNHQPGAPIEVELTDDAAVRGFFSEMVPEHDEVRVYHSDIRKLIKWYNALLEKNLLSFEEEGEVEVTAEVVEASSDADGDEAEQSEAEVVEEADEAEGAEDKG